MSIRIFKTAPNWNNLENDTLTNPLTDENTGLKWDLMEPDHWFEQVFRELFGKSAERTRLSAVDNLCQSLWKSDLGHCRL